MHAYLIVGGSEESRTHEALTLATKQKVKLLEFTLEKISDTRTLNDFLKLSPGNISGILIKDIDRAGTESLNAFLKNLEEKASYLFLLTAANINMVLPTIVSRCQVIRVGPQDHDQKEVKRFLKADTPERLVLIENYKVRVQALEFCDNLLSYGNTLLKEAEDKAKYAKILRETLELKKRLSANTNPLLQLTSFVVSLDE